MRQCHVHPDERRAGEHAERGRSEREGEVGGDHGGVADEQDPDFDFFDFFFSNEFLRKSVEFFILLLSPGMKKSLTCSCP